MPSLTCPNNRSASGMRASLEARAKRLRSSSVRLSLALLASVLAGCAAVGPDYQAAAPATPVDWSAWHGGSADLSDARLRQRTDSPPEENIATLFNDPALKTLQARALTANLDLKTAALRFAQSRVQRLTIAAQQGVQVGARGGVTRERDSENGAESRLFNAIAPPAEVNQLISVLSTPTNLYDAGFDASWELDLWGRIRRSIEAADASVDGAAAALHQVQLDISTELARNYVELRGAQQQLRLMREAIATNEESLSLIKAQADGGLTNDLDANRQRAKVADMRALLPGLLDQEAQAANQLTLLIGEHPGALRLELAARAEADEKNATTILPDLALGVPSEVALRRPDIQAAQARLHVATANIGIATADLYPRLTLGASFGFDSVVGNKFGEWGSRQWSIGPNFTLPIFDQGRRRATIQLRTLEQQEAAIAYQQTVLKAWHEIDSALTTYTAEQRRQQQLGEKVRNNRITHNLAQSRYRHGLTDALAELDARSALLEAQRDAAQSASLLAIRLISIYKALGGAAPNSERAQ